MSLITLSKSGGGFDPEYFQDQDFGYKVFGPMAFGYTLECQEAVLKKINWLCRYRARAFIFIDADPAVSDKAYLVWAKESFPIDAARVFLKRKGVL